MKRKTAAALAPFSEAATADLSERLRRIEGQVRGVERMVQEGRDCKEILHQLTAIRSAAYQVSLKLVKDYATQCLIGAEDEDAVDDLMKTLTQMPY